MGETTETTQKQDPVPQWERVRAWRYHFQDAEEFAFVEFRALPHPDLMAESIVTEGQTGHVYSYDLLRKGVNLLWALYHHDREADFWVYVVPGFDMPALITIHDPRAGDPCVLVAPRYQPPGEKPPGPKVWLGLQDTAVADAGHVIALDRWPMEFKQVLHKDWCCPDCGGEMEQEHPPTGQYYCLVCGRAEDPEDVEGSS